jgi:diguanylate cyclase (GGDEF)-like protein
MKKEWKSTRITLLLYAIILLLPIGMFSNYRLYSEVRQTAYEINRIMKIPEGILLIVSGTTDAKDQKMLDEIHKEVGTAEKWVKQHTNDRDYVGGGKLEALYVKTYACWQSIYNERDKATTLQPKCLKLTHSLIFALERMYLLKQNRFEQIFFITGAILLALLLLTIYLVRLYLYRRVRENALYDFETKLYNRRFMEETYRNMCATIKRYKKTMSILSLQVPQLNPNDTTITKEERKKTLHKVGEILWNMTRDSDFAFHTEDENFVLLLPETTQKQSEVVKQRLKSALHKELGGKITVDCHICEASDEKSCDTAFMKCITR